MNLVYGICAPYCWRNVSCLVGLVNPRYAPWYRNLWRVENKPIASAEQFTDCQFGVTHFGCFARLTRDASAVDRLQGVDSPSVV